MEKSLQGGPMIVPHTFMLREPSEPVRAQGSKQNSGEVRWGVPGSFRAARKPHFPGFQGETVALNGA